MNIFSDPAPPRGERTASLRGALNWLMAGRRTGSANVQAQLLQHGQLNITTLVMLMLSMSLIASTAIALTGQAWAWAWLLAEIVIGSVKLSMQRSIEKTTAAGVTPSMTGAIVAGLAGAVVLGIAGFECVAYGDPLLILLSGICLGGLVGGTSVRSAGTPRFTVVLMSLMTLPFSFATLFSPIPYLHLIGLLMPLLLIGLILVLQEDYKKLVGLYQAQHENRWLAHHDILTGLPNRTMELKCFDDLLRNRITKPVDGVPLFTVFCLDLDGFKDVNDSLGHEAGDTVLVIVADRLRRCVRDVDFQFRVGGDEFVILLPSIDPSAAAAIAQRIIDRIAKPLDVGNNNTLRIGVSIGSAYATAHGTTADELLRSADGAMYEAKRRGKGMYVTLPSVPKVMELPEVKPGLAMEVGVLLHPAIGFPLPLAGKSV